MTSTGSSSQAAVNPKQIVIDIDQPRYDQTSLHNRLRHFYSIINPLYCLATTKELDNAMATVKRYRTTGSVSSVEDLWRSKGLVDSAFNPDTLEKIPIVGRKSFEAPGCTMTCSAMLLFTGPIGGTLAQVVHQTWMSYTNYANRNGTCPVDTMQLAQGLTLAVGGSVVALNLTKSYCAKWFGANSASSFAGRILPAGVACSVAHILNVPFTRHRELIDGVDVFTVDGKLVGKSQIAAGIGITAVTVTRLVNAWPDFIIGATIMRAVEKQGVAARSPMAIGALLVSVFVGEAFTAPFSCALFAPQLTISKRFLESSLGQGTSMADVEVVRFNRGL
jgi:hypothetical protein